MSEGIFTDEETKELLGRLLEANPGGLSEDVLLRAFLQLENMRISATLLEGAFSGRFLMVWSDEAGEILWDVPR